MIYKIQKTFSSAHFYQQLQWSEEKNKEVFGKCFTRFGHGHDYTLQIEFETSDLQGFQKALDSCVGQLDHQHLNFVFEEFKNKVPTTENLSLFLREQILKNLAQRQVQAILLGLKLLETPQIWVES